MLRMEFVFTFNNTSDAINSERLLLGGGVAVKVMPLPSSLGAGCGLCLRLGSADLHRAGRLLNEATVQPQAIYAKSAENGETIYTLLEERGH